MSDSFLHLLAWTKDSASQDTQHIRKYHERTQTPFHIRCLTSKDLGDPHGVHEWLAGAEQATFSWVALWSTTREMLPKEIEILHQGIHAGCDVAVASRFHPHSIAQYRGRRLHYLGQKFSNFIKTHTYHRITEDSNPPCVLMSREIGLRIFAPESKTFFHSMSAFLKSLQSQSLCLKTFPIMWQLKR